MSTKFKALSKLSIRHKKRQVEEIHNNRRVQLDNSSSEKSTLDTPERLEEESFQPELRDVPCISDNNDAIQQFSDDDGDATMSSDVANFNEENREQENGDDDIPERQMEPENNDVDEITNSESSDAGSDEDNAEQDLGSLQRRAMKNIFLAANVNLAQGNFILEGLRQFPFNLTLLPKDSRTVFNTPTFVAASKIQKIAGGEYLHIGFKKTLLKKLAVIPENALPDNLLIDLSTDGFKPDKGKDQLWPHQYRIFNVPDKRPMVAGVWKGENKPSNPFEFYEQLVTEILEIIEDGGILFRNRRIPLTFRCFVADAPARAFVLNHYGHNSVHPCSKCKIEGHRCTIPGFGGTEVFVGIQQEPRTDEEYESLVDEDHHKGRSPLTPILPLVTRVPFEIMHSVWLGNAKKIISAQVAGKFGFRRLNGRRLDILDSRMLQLKSYCPSEFNRRPQEITMVHSFKATEFRQFLLYTVPNVVKNVFHENYYEHLMILHSVLRLLISEETPREMYPFCQQALETYVTLAQQLYGEQFLSYNLHALLHLVADVETLGPLKTFSAFCFENNMPQLRKCIHRPGQKLEQILKRIYERNDVSTTPLDGNARISLSKRHAKGPFPNDVPARRCQQFETLKISEFTFSTALRDSCCSLQDSRICCIKNIILIDGQVLLIVQEFRLSASIYDVGITSDLVHVYHCRNLRNRLEVVPLVHVKSKMYRMPKWSDNVGEEERVLQGKWVCVSLLSTFQVPENAIITY